MNKSILIIGILLIGIATANGNYFEQQVIANVLPGGIDILSPLQDAVYTDRMVYINLSMSSNVSYFKYQIDNRTTTTLCRDCNSYANKKPFDDGLNEIKIIAMFESGNVSEFRNFTVDTAVPKIKKTSPIRGFANGTFEIEFDEANPINLSLYYGNNLTGYGNKDIILESCTKTKTTKCSAFVDVSDYHNKTLEYWFNLTDIANKTVGSKITKLDVDVYAPILDNFNYLVNGSYVTFTINITEDNFDEITYTDFVTGRTAVLCSSLIKMGCEKKKIFSDGEHNLEIQIKDEAGLVTKIPEIIFEI